MDIYKYTRKEDITAVQTQLQKNYLPSDTWGVIEIHIAPEQAEKYFCELISSEVAKKEQTTFELLSQRFPDKYGNIVPADKGKISYCIFPTETGSKILFVTNYAQKPLKKIFSDNTTGTCMKINTAKIRNRFEPINWKRASWFFVAFTLITGNETEFATVGRYS